MAAPRLTAAQLRREAERDRQRALQIGQEMERLGQQVKALFEMVAYKERLALAMDEQEMVRLPDPNKARTIAKKMAQQVQPQQGARRRGRPTVTDHPFPRALEQHGITVKEWADAHGYDRARVRTWFATGAAARRIPHAVAVKLRDEYGISLDSWPAGIK